MSYLDLAKRILAEQAAEPATRLDPADCLRLLDIMHAEIRAEYEPGAFPWALEHMPELVQRLHSTEAAIDRLAGNGPTESEWRAALDGHAVVWREMVARYHAHQERVREL